MNNKGLLTAVDTLFGGIFESLILPIEFVMSIISLPFKVLAGLFDPDTP